LGDGVYGVHASESKRVLQQRSVDRGSIVEPKKPWASFGYSVLTLCVSGYVSLDWPPKWTFWSLLYGKGGQLQGLTCRPRSHLAPGGRGKLVFLFHAPCVTLSRKWLARLHPKRVARRPQASTAHGLSSCAQGLAGVASQAGAKARARACRQLGT
jgi:hypothetical protein